MFKKILIGVVILACIAGGGAYLLLGNLNFFVQEAIEKYGTEITGVEVKVGGVSINTSSGEGGITQLTIRNPKDFPSPYAFTMSNITLKLDTHSLFGDGPVIIQEIAIDSPQVTFEVINTINSNLQTIARNIKNYSSPRKTGGNTAETSSSKPERKMIISDFTLRGGQITISHNLLKGKVLTTPLSTVHLTDIGKDSGGVTASQAAKQILSNIVSGAIHDAEAQISTQTGPLHNITDKIKGFFGK